MKDLQKLINQLSKSQVFEKKATRCHKQFRKSTSNVMSTVDLTEINRWMNQKYLLMTTYNDIYVVFAFAV